MEEQRRSRWYGVGERNGFERKEERGREGNVEADHFLSFPHVPSLLQTGNFGFGVQEHIDLGIKYDPGIGESPFFSPPTLGRTHSDVPSFSSHRASGIFGMDFYVVMGRPGMRVGESHAPISVFASRPRETKK